MLTISIFAIGPNGNKLVSYSLWNTVTKEELREKMKKASAQLEFEEAAKIRDETKRLEILELNIRSGSISENSGES